MARRITPEDDIDRINERLRSQARLQIQDRDSYDLSFNTLIDMRESELSGKQLDLRNKAFSDFSSKNPNVSTQRLFKKARGKDLSRDRKQTAKTVVPTVKEFRKRGASAVQRGT